jgi:hypothetical protein
MAQGGSGRPGGKARPTGRNASGGRGQSGARSNKQTAAAAQRAIQGARGGNPVLRVVLPAAVVVVVAALVVVGVLLSSKHGNSSAAGATTSATQPQDVDNSPAILASTTGQASGETVDGVGSNDMEQVLFHVHAHLSMYVNGQAKLLPYGVGIVPPYQLQPIPGGGEFVAGGSKYYWLHTHDETGLIHIESPVQRTYTLGEFFDIWHQPLSATRVGPATGKVTAFLNGKEYTGDPRNIPLDAHNVIQLDVGTVVPFANYTFPSGV